uniref:EamA domain-containing protein n=1 Tax=Tetradesmus obliquus TaxID=3088 RepID=A0A383W667_TETOB|eukprot:jgi/Sobl393_1/19681/SZX72514.1
MGSTKQQPAAEASSPAPADKALTVTQQLQAKAALPELSRVNYAFWVVMAVLAQLNWGLYPVCTRYLQTSTNHKPIPTLQLAVVINIIAYPALVIFYTIPSRIRAHLAKRKQQQQQQQWQQQQCNTALDMASSASCGALEVPPALLNPDQDPNDSTAAKDEPLPPLKERLKAGARVAAVATIVGGIVALQALTNIYAARLALAYLVQLVFMFGPLVVALANTYVLKQPSPPKLYPTLAAAIIGAAVVLIGQWLQSRATGAAGGFSLDTLWGLLLALTSTLLLAAYFVLLQVTRRFVTGEQILWANRNVALLLFTPLSLLIEGTDWSWVFLLTPAEWGILVYTGVSIYTLGNIFIQSSTRRVGSPLVSVFLSMRLVASILGSIVLLHDIPTSPVTWVGFGLVIGVLSAFLALQAYVARKKAAAAEAAAAAASKDDDAECGVADGAGKQAVVDVESPCSNGTGKHADSK